MLRAFQFPQVKCPFVPVVMALALLLSATVYAGDTSVHLEKGDITGITRVAVRKDGKVTIYIGSARRIVDMDKLPPEFLKSWGIDATAAAASLKQSYIDGIEKAL